MDIENILGLPYHHSPTPAYHKANTPSTFHKSFEPDLEQ